MYEDILNYGGISDVSPEEKKRKLTANTRMMANMSGPSHSLDVESAKTPVIDAISATLMDDVYDLIDTEMYAEMDAIHNEMDRLNKAIAMLEEISNVVEDVTEEGLATLNYNVNCIADLNDLSNDPEYTTEAAKDKKTLGEKVAKLIKSAIAKLKKLIKMALNAVKVKFSGNTKAYDDAIKAEKEITKAKLGDKVAVHALNTSGVETDKGFNIEYLMSAFDDYVGLENALVIEKHFKEYAIDYLNKSEFGDKDKTAEAALGYTKQLAEFLALKEGLKEKIVQGKTLYLSDTLPGNKQLVVGYDKTGGLMAGTNTVKGTSVSREDVKAKQVIDVSRANVVAAKEAIQKFKDLNKFIVNMESEMTKSVEEETNSGSVAKKMAAASAITKDYTAIITMYFEYSKTLCAGTNTFIKSYISKSKK